LWHFLVFLQEVIGWMKKISCFTGILLLVGTGRINENVGLSQVRWRRWPLKGRDVMELEDDESQDVVSMR